MQTYLVLAIAALATLLHTRAAAAPLPPESTREGVSIYVSKLGDNSNGASWATAFTTIQRALDAIPDRRGGHRIIIRPDTYMEAMLSPAHKGAAKAYNLLVGDTDGSLGSGATGHVVIDSGDPAKGFKSYDWWGPIRSNEQGWSKEHTDATFSAIGWDRWIVRNLYVTGGDGGLFWDLTNEVKPFTIVVEDCTAIGRAFGGGVANCLSRPDEPMVFRRCNLWALDWWGDTAGAYVRVENETMPAEPDIFFEDCTMVSPQCALKAGNFGFTTSMYIKVERSRLVALNFSQPQGTPIDGAIQSVEQGKLLHIDLEDTTVMGYKVFGVRVNKETAKDIQYTTSGNCLAYVQFQQRVPKGFHRLQQWPVDVFQTIAPPPPPKRKSDLGKTEVIRKNMCEMSGIVWQGRLVHMACVRPAHGGTREDYYLELSDAETGEVLAKFAEGHGLACAHVQDGVFYAFASRFEDNNWNDVTMFKSRDLKNWESKIVIEQEDEHLFNSSVCEGPDGFVMAYESNDPAYPAFTTKFARSTDLETWTKQRDATFGTNRYTACPCVRYVNGYYYVLYLERRSPRHYFETYITRSRDLRRWELSSANPVLRPTEIDDGINASDPEVVEFGGKTYIYYAVGDQLTWMNIKRAEYPGTLDQYFEQWYEQPGIEDRGTLAAAAEDAALAERQAWFNDAKFGIFVHWGLYALHAKNDKGPYVSWAMENEGIPVAEYALYADRFNPTKFDADAWMALAREAGARYLTFTSKHHEGFSMFDSALTDYDSVDRAAKRDFVGELVAAARKAGIRIAFYYSMLDWYHPDFKADLPKYVDEFLFGQVRELCTNYGPIDGIWFDGEWDHPQATWRAPELVAMIRELQPGAVVNDRLGKGERGVSRLCDFYTREQPSEIRQVAGFERTRPYPWEACMTIGESWGYKDNDNKLMSSAELIRELVNIAGRGGNLLLNVGPTADGEIPEPLAERLRDIGAWLAKNGESIYGTHASPFGKLSKASCTTKGNRLYIHLESRPGDTLELPGLKTPIKKAWFLETGETLKVSNENRTIALPKKLPNDIVTTVAIELDGAPEVA
ncbi:MAG: hypothetical protein GWP08_11380 [Nitrospiraceae bacterium]|nr:hypothetical protein [Nitrospiraceae bacterium]